MFPAFAFITQHYFDIGIINLFPLMYNIFPYDYLNYLPILSTMDF